MRCRRKLPAATTQKVVVVVILAQHVVAAAKAKAVSSRRLHHTLSSAIIAATAHRRGNGVDTSALFCERQSAEEEQQFAEPVACGGTQRGERCLVEERRREESTIIGIAYACRSIRRCVPPMGWEFWLTAAAAAGKDRAEINGAIPIERSFIVNVLLFIILTVR